MWIFRTGRRQILPQLQEIIQWHLQGTDFGIGVDPEDGLLRQGAPGYQLTWMDAKVGDWVVTPRRGKAVEINALCATLPGTSMRLRWCDVVFANRLNNRRWLSLASRQLFFSMCVSGNAGREGLYGWR